MDNLLHFDIQEVISAFVVLFAVIDITGLVPIIIDLKEKGNEINAGKAAFYSLFSFIVFLFMGNMMLQLFHVDIESFAVAGAFACFLMYIFLCHCRFVSDFRNGYRDDFWRGDF